MHVLHYYMHVHIEHEARPQKFSCHHSSLFVFTIITIIIIIIVSFVLSIDIHVSTAMTIDSFTSYCH